MKKIVNCEMRSVFRSPNGRYLRRTQPLASRLCPLFSTEAEPPLIYSDKFIKDHEYDDAHVSSYCANTQ